MTNENNLRILIIDDNVAIHEDFRKVLKTDEDMQRMDEVEKALLRTEELSSKLELNYEIESAYSGEEGYLLVKKSLDEGNPYALMFVDIVMPKWDGIETIKRIWTKDPNIQTVICTAYSDYSWKQIVKHLGVSDRLLILKKPFDNIEVRQIACCLTRKWNLNKLLNQRLQNLHQSFFNP